MPLYEYECGACGHRFEKIQKFSDPLVQVCPSCGKGPVNKLLSAPAIQFKGTGWYITDYAGKNPNAANASNSSASESKTETKTETKTDTTPASTPAPGAAPAADKK
jgi:putative FmdB family regulatory protein